MLTKLLTMWAKKPTVHSATSIQIPSDANLFKTGEQLLEPHLRYVKNIRMDSGASDDFFDRYYLPCLIRFAETMQLRPYGQEGEYKHLGGAVEAGVKRAAMALKLRLGKLLPRNAPAEEIAYRQQCWTYGVFVTALMREMGGQLFNVRLVGFDKHHKMKEKWNGWMEPIHKYAYYKMQIDSNVTRTLSRTSSIVLMPKIVPEHGLLWLHDDQALLDEMLDTLSGAHTSSENMIYSLVSEATMKSLNNTKLVFRRPDSLLTKEMIDMDTGEILRSNPEGLQAAVKSPQQSSESKSVPATEQSMEQEKPLVADLTAPVAEIVFKDISPEKASFTPMATEANPDDQLAVIGDELIADAVMDFEQANEEESVREVSAENFAVILQEDIRFGLITDDSVMINEGALQVKYPLVFKLYTDSPLELLNELRLQGKVIEECKPSGRDATRVIVIKAS